MSDLRTSRPVRCSAFAFAFCILAVLFAVEAKLAWYSPAGFAVSDISAAKARPIENPEVVSQSFIAPESTHSQLVFAHIAAFTAAIALRADETGNVPNYIHQTFFTASNFSSHLFYRPPPVR
jgi:hypothetical protein